MMGTVVMRRQCWGPRWDSWRRTHGRADALLTATMDGYTNGEKAALEYLAQLFAQDSRHDTNGAQQLSFLRVSDHEIEAMIFLYPYIDNGIMKGTDKHRVELM